MQSPDKGSRVSNQGGGKVGWRQSRENELIDGIEIFSGVWNGRADRGSISPVILPFRTLLYPLLDRVDLRRSEEKLEDRQPVACKPQLKDWSRRLL